MSVSEGVRGQTVLAFLCRAAMMNAGRVRSGNIIVFYEVQRDATER